jgi:hypothetical protein
MAPFRRAAPQVDRAFLTDAMDAVRDRLKLADFPQEYIVRDWSVGRKYRADMALLDPVSRAPVAVIELRKDLDEDSIRTARKELESFADAIGNPGVRQYIGTLERGTVRLFKVPREVAAATKEDLIPAKLPAFDHLVSTARAAMVSDKRVQHRERGDLFKWVCWAMALLVVAVLVVDAFGWYTLNEARLALIGAAAALVVIPFASRLKMLGVEFERSLKVAEQPTVLPDPARPATPPVPPVDPGVGKTIVGKVTKKAKDVAAAVVP